MQQHAQRQTLAFDTIIDSIMQQAYSQFATGQKCGPTPYIESDPGAGKCLSVGTLVMRHDGTLVPVESVQTGDLLMGPDSLPRMVTSTCRGRSPLYEITPVKGEPWVCNDAHILTLVHSHRGHIIDIPVQAYMNQTANFRKEHKQFTPAGGIDFPPAPPLSVDPYFLGVWMGDGTKNLTRGKGAGKTRTNPLIDQLRLLFGTEGNTPHPALRTASRVERLALLAGIIDTDGHVSNGCVEITQKHESYADCVAFIARSLGLRVTRKLKYVQGYPAPYHRLGLSGDLSVIPTRIARKTAAKRMQVKCATRTAISVRPLGEGDYAGFTLDATTDCRFLLGDFTVTHNSSVLAYESSNTLAKLLSSPVYFHSFNALEVNYLDISGGAFIADQLSDEPLLQRTRPDQLVLPNKDDLATYKYVVILVDELDKAPMESKQVLAGLLQDNRLGIYDLPYDRFFVCAAGNRVGTKTGGTELFTHTVNRMRIYEATQSTRRWLDSYALDPKNRVSPFARSFVSERGDLFNAPTKFPTTANTPYLTLRSFTQGTTGLPFCLDLGVDPLKIDATDPGIFARILSQQIAPMAQAILAGSIGTDCAKDYLAWAQNHTKVPTRQHVLDDPKKALLPSFQTDPSAMHAAASFLLAWARPDDTKMAHLEQFGTYAMRFDANKRANLILDIAKANKNFVRTKVFTTFAVENPALVTAMLQR